MLNLALMLFGKHHKVSGIHSKANVSCLTIVNGPVLEWRYNCVLVSSSRKQSALSHVNSERAVVRGQSPSELRIRRYFS
jgi:hypothetical protein